MGDDLNAFVQRVLTPRFDVDVFIIGDRGIHTLAYRTSDATFSTDIRSRRKKTLGLCMTFISTVLRTAREVHLLLLAYVFLKYMYVLRVILRFDPFRRDIKFIYTKRRHTHDERPWLERLKKTFFPSRSWRRFHVGNGFARIRPFEINERSSLMSLECTISQASFL